jgi:hypothetical protein
VKELWQQLAIAGLGLALALAIMGFVYLITA